jgi:hypothetical protein
MTLPDERYRAVMWAGKFLQSIADKRSGLSEEMKVEARNILRHYPSEWDLEEAAEGAPHVFAKRMEELYRMVKQYEQDKDESSK